MKSTLQDPLERKLYASDLESYVSENPKAQEETEVWSAAFCPVLRHPEPWNVTVYNNLFQHICDLERLDDESIVFYQNSKFDLSFILNELDKLGFTPAYTLESMRKKGEDGKVHPEYQPDFLQKYMQFSYKICVSDMNIWYGVRITFADRTIEIRDSSKILPMSLEEIGNALDTKYKKLEMEYEGERHAFYEITDEELEYIQNDVLVLSEAIYKMWYDYNITFPTIGSQARHNFEQMIGKERCEKLFPPLHTHELPTGETAYDYCKKAYSGGWCWKNPVASDHLFYDETQHFPMLERWSLVETAIRTKICVYDVNSLYPSVLENSKYIEGYPCGKPKYHKGEPSIAECKQYAVFRRFKCRFKKKDGMLPFIHIRGDKGYNANECLTSSVDVIGNDPVREYTMTQVEYDMFIKHYNVYDYEAVDYLTFTKVYNVFNEYVRYYAQMKIEAVKTGNKGMKTVAKLFLNSLYGKLSQNTNSSYKTIRFEDGVMKFETHEQNKKVPWYIAAGAYVTAYARRFTITAAQQNYYEGELKGIMYADTDSMHIIGIDPHDVKGIVIDDSEFRCWAPEASACAVAIYAKQKTYIEVVTEESFKKLDEPKLIIKAAGLGKKGKEVFKKLLNKQDEETGEYLDKDPDKDIYINDFRYGLTLEDANLKAVQVKGGIVLKPDVWKIR